MGAEHAGICAGTVGKGLSHIMQIVIPMSGLGSRFVEKGYRHPKPLIKVEGRTMIDWVVSMFPGEKDFTFICRDSHLQETAMAAELNRLAPEGKIVAIEGHKKGPVYALIQAFPQIKDDEPVIVTYCDYYMVWGYVTFKKEAFERKCDGALPCYTGFHPHLIRKSNLYASCRIDEEGNLVEIREKFSWEENKEESFHSPGVFYFASGALLKKYCQIALERDLSLNGEYYVSLVYNPLVSDGLKVWVPANIDYFCQWGTPQDLDEYLFWNEFVSRYSA